MMTCPECDGNGLRENYDYNDPTGDECPECRGRGIVAYSSYDCRACRGTGLKNQTEDCPKCKGTGLKR